MQACLFLCISHLANHTTSSQVLLLRTYIKDYNLEKSFLNYELILGDFNAKSKLWFDQVNTLYEVSILNDLVTRYGPTQIIQKPTHILESSIS